MSHIEKAKAAINDRLAAAYGHRSDPIMHHSECKEALAVVVRLIEDYGRRPTASARDQLVWLARDTLAALEKLDNGQRARLD